MLIVFIVNFMKGLAMNIENYLGVTKINKDEFITEINKKIKSIIYNEDDSYKRVMNNKIANIDLTMFIKKIMKDNDIDYLFNEIGEANYEVKDYIINNLSINCIDHNYYKLFFIPFVFENDIERPECKKNIYNMRFVHKGTINEELSMMLEEKYEQKIDVLFGDYVISHNNLLDIPESAIERITESIVYNTDIKDILPGNISPNNYHELCYIPMLISSRKYSFIHQFHFGDCYQIISDLWLNNVIKSECDTKIIFSLPNLLEETKKAGEILLWNNINEVYINNYINNKNENDNNKLNIKLVMHWDKNTNIIKYINVKYLMIENNCSYFFQKKREFFNEIEDINYVIGKFLKKEFIDKSIKLEILNKLI